MSKLEIISGLAFDADFTILSSDGLTPEVLNPADTARFSVYSAGDDTSCVITNVAMTIADAANGLFNLQLTAEQTKLLSQYIGFREDRYSTIGNYMGVIDATLVSGNRTATIPVFVKEISCPAT